LDNQERRAEVDEASYFVLVSQYRTEHLNKSFFAVLVVNEVLILLDQLEAGGKLLRPKLLAHEVGEAFEVTARDVNHVLLRVRTAVRFWKRLRVEGVLVALRVTVITVSVVRRVLRDL